MVRYGSKNGDQNMCLEEIALHAQHLHDHLMSPIILTLIMNNIFI